MPKQGLQMTEGIIIKWLIDEGDSISEGEDLFEVETDKLTMNIPAAASGKLLKILRAPGDTVPVAEPIAIIGEEGEDISGLLNDNSKPAVIYATPRAKAAAKLRGIDYREVAGSGPDGLVIENDILKAAAQNVSIPVRRDTIPAREEATREQRDANRERGESPCDRGETLVPLTGMRRTVATRMKSSLNEMAQLYHSVTVDMTEAALMRESLKNTGRKVSYNDIILWRTAKALTEFPVINAIWSDKGIIQKNYVNLGFAVALDEGLIVPVIKDADLLTLQEIAACSAGLADKAKHNKLARDEYTGGTFTVTNLGMFDIDCFTAIINPPEAGILAVGKIAKQPAVVDDEIVVRPLMQLSLTYDHRIVDGAPAAQFLRRVKELLENL